MNPGFDPRGLVLVMSGHDPSGGAGVQADIETVAALDSRCATLITATTTQNTRCFDAIHPQPAAQFRKQAKLLLEDMNFSACKIGLLGTAEMAACVAGIVEDAGRPATVLDPVSHAGAGGWSAEPELLTAMREKLLPIVALATPNRREAMELTGQPNAQDAARSLVDEGCSAVLLTGTDEIDPKRPGTIVHRLYQGEATPTEYEFPRLAHAYHGSGCTLSAAIAVYLAQGEVLVDAVRQGLHFTWTTLEQGQLLGRGQWHPHRTPPRK